MENFPSLWDKIEELIRSDRLKMSELVFDEAMGGKVLRDWCNIKKISRFFYQGLMIQWKTRFKLCDQNIQS